jgi:hypothetical protein
MLRNGPFSLNQDEFSASIPDMIEYFKYGHDLVQVDKFVYEVKELLKIKEHKITHFRNLHR